MKGSYGLYTLKQVDSGLIKIHITHLCMNPMTFEEASERSKMGSTKSLPTRVFRLPEDDTAGAMSEISKTISPIKKSLLHTSYIGFVSCKNYGGNSDLCLGIFSTIKSAKRYPEVDILGFIYHGCEKRERVFDTSIAKDGDLWGL